MIKILFICHGNICRSTMAQYIFEEMVRQEGLEESFQIDSAATSREEIGNDVDRRARKKLGEEGIPCGHHRARQITKADYEDFDYLVLMDEENRYGIRRIIPRDPEHKISLLLDWTEEPRDVADPWYTGDFDKAFSDIRTGCSALMKKLSQS